MTKDNSIFDVSDIIVIKLNKTVKKKIESLH